MCLWNRPERLADTLRMLDAQDYVDGIELYLWNNNRADHKYYLDVLRRFAARGSLVSVTLARSPHNVGSIGRFYWARAIAKIRPATPIIVIDDDENFTSAFVSQAQAAYRPEVLAGWWAWTIGEGYWDRTRAGEGDRVDHVGPGGSIMSAAIFLDDAFFTSIPDRFGLIDDIWLNYFAQRRGLSLSRLPVDIEFVLDETNQHHTQGYVKPEFFNFLYGQNSRPFLKG